MSKRDYYTTIETVNTYNNIVPLLRSLYDEFKDLSKKKPDAAVSKTKIDIVNRLLTRVRDVLHDQESIKFLDLIDEDNMPQVSDITIMLSQYVAAMAAFEGKYCPYDEEQYKNIWLINKKGET